MPALASNGGDHFLNLHLRVLRLIQFSVTLMCLFFHQIYKNNRKRCLGSGSNFAAVTEDVIQTVNTKEDALVLKYDNFKRAGISQIRNDVEEIFLGNPAKDSILEIAAPLLKAHDAVQKMKEATRWDRAEQVVTLMDWCFIAGCKLLMRQRV